MPNRQAISYKNPMKKQKISKLSFIFFPILLVSGNIQAADLSYLFDIKACANGTVLKKINNNEKHKIFNFNIDSINVLSSTLILEKPQEAWIKEIASNINEINKNICLRNKSCIPVKDLKEIRFFNTLKASHVLKIEISASLNQITEILKKNNFEIIEMPARKFGNTEMPKSTSIYTTRYKDEKQQSTRPEIFKSVKDYLEYYQAYYGANNINVNIDPNSTNQKTVMNYNCNFNFASADDPAIVAPKYNLTYLAPPPLPNRY